MRVRHVPVLALLATLAACSAAPVPEAENGAAVETNVEALAPRVEPSNVTALTPVDPAPALDRWLVGTWSFDEVCGSSDFAVAYRADGSLDNSGHLGRWEIDGNRVTETVTEAIENGGETPTRLAAPETRSYTVQRIDSKRGVIRFEGRRIPILRC